MAAVSLAVMSVAEAGDHILVNAHLYVYSLHFFSQACPAMGIEVGFVDLQDEEAIQKEVRPNTKAIFTEIMQFSKSHLLEPDFAEWACDFTRLYGLFWVTFGKLRNYHKP